MSTPPFAARIREIVTLLGGNQRGFARVVGSSEPNVRKWLDGSGMPRSGTMDRLRRRLGLTYEQILGEAPLPPGWPSPALGLAAGDLRKRESEDVRNAQLVLAAVKQMRSIHEQQMRLQSAQAEALEAMIEALTSEVARETKGDRAPSRRLRSVAGG